MTRVAVTAATVAEVEPNKFGPPVPTKMGDVDRDLTRFLGGLATNPTSGRRSVDDSRDDGVSFE